MVNKFRVLFVYLLMAVLLAQPLALAIDPKSKVESCSQHFQDVLIEQTNASAGIFANFVSRPGSVSYESEAFLRKALDQIENIKPPPYRCSPGCKMDSIPYVYLRSEPNKLLEDYSEKTYCLEQHANTSKAPIEYNKDAISSVEELVAWVGELAQGKGVDGKDLYRKCDKSCSPRYEYKIIKNQIGKQLAATASIICGEARDKTDNLYKLKSFLRWRCAPIK